MHAASATRIDGPYLHPDAPVDVAALVVQGIEAPAVPLGSHLDDWLGDEDFVLREVTVMGYPRIPLSERPVLVSTRAEISAVVDLSDRPHPHFLISSMARNGLIGGVCFIEWNFALGLVTSSLKPISGSAEPAHMAVISVEPIYTCLAHHRIMPSQVEDGWDDFWGLSQNDYARIGSDESSNSVGSVGVFDNGRECYLQIRVEEEALRAAVLLAATAKFGTSAYSIRNIRRGMDRIVPQGAYSETRRLVNEAGRAASGVFLEAGLIGSGFSRLDWA